MGRCAAPFVAAFFDLDVGQRAELATLRPDLPGARGEELMRTLRSPKHFREMHGIQRARQLAAVVLERIGTPAGRALVTKSGAGVQPKSYASDVRSYPSTGLRSKCCATPWSARRGYARPLGWATIREGPRWPL